MTEKNLLIVAHAPSENTKRLLEAVKDGAASDDTSAVSVTALSPFDAGPEQILAANAIILGTTENLGYMSGALKDFFDRSYYPVLEKTQGLPYCLYIRAGHDGTGTRRGVETITTGLRWRAVQEPLICHGEWDEDFVGQCHDLGAAMAAGLDLGVF
ncbi:MAG: flavodoxin [Rhodospirillaceae bacterium]|nr:flavodoxin [Rhodospirillaceae bacterium]HAA91933.1 flavodoxin [Rhodospirillaceae bacterium]|tara:strand:- start:437 stop:904 length:468 start_codon:yes stop_codon:yes gene_type:complete